MITVSRSQENDHNNIIQRQLTIIFFGLLETTESSDHEQYNIVTGANSKLGVFFRITQTPSISITGNACYKLRGC